MDGVNCPQKIVLRENRFCVIRLLEFLKIQGKTFFGKNVFICNTHNMKIHLLILLLLFFTHELSAKKTHLTTPNLLYLEAGGAGGYWSLNFEKIVFQKKRFSLSPRVGISSYRFFDYSQKINPDFLIPFGVQSHFGKKNHKISFGLGITYANIVRANRFTFKTDRKSSFSTNLSVGYRYFPVAKKGLYLGIHYSPILEFNKYYRNWYALSFGYAFANSKIS